MRKLAFAGIAGSLASAGPCDIYASGGTPCVAAHSTTRALYDHYLGSLYQIKRGSDQVTADVGPVSAGRVANSASQDEFCKGTTCVITIIYDQSGHGNHLTQAPPGGAARGPDHDGYDYLASAIGAPVTLNGQKAYGVFISPFTGYRNDQRKQNGETSGWRKKGRSGDHGLGTAGNGTGDGERIRCDKKGIAGRYSIFTTL